MSLGELATQLNNQATSSGRVLLDSATLTTGTGLEVPAGLDELIGRGFNLPTGTSLVVTAPQIGTAGPTTLTMTGAVIALAIPVTITVTFSVPAADDPHLSFVIVASLGRWTFRDSFPSMIGFPYDDIALNAPTSLFSSDDVAAYEFTPQGGQSHVIALTAGMNLAALTALPDFADLVIAFVPGFSPAQILVLSGVLDPGGVDNSTVLLPRTDLHVPIQHGAVASVAWLPFENAALGISVTHVAEPGDIVETELTYFAVDLPIGPGAGLECTALLIPNNSILELSVAPEDAPALPIDTIFKALMGGNTWYAVIPQPLQYLFAAVAFKGFTATINTSGGLELVGVSVTVGSATPWPLFGGITIASLDLTWFIDSPLDTPSMSGRLSADITLPWKCFEGELEVTVTTDLLVTGDFEGVIKFNELVADMTGGVVKIPDGFVLDFTAFGFSIDPTNHAYSMHAVAQADLDLLGTSKVSITDIELALSMVQNPATRATEYAASLSGLIDLGLSTTFSLAANYDGTAGLWHFEGGLAPGSTVPLSVLINQLLPAIGDKPFLPGDLEVTPLWLTVDVPIGTRKGSYSLDAGMRWAFSSTPLGAVSIAARVQLAYDGNLPVHQYSGSLAGEFKLLGLDVVLGYSFAQGNNLLFVRWAGFEATYDTSTDVITFTIDKWTFGGLVAELVGAFTGDPHFELPTPWNLLNDISLKGFKVAVNLTTKQVTASYSFSGSLKLFFITIHSIDFAKTDTGVDISVTATMIGDDKPKPYPVDPVNGTAPAVPGQDTTAFQLQLLALGQRVTIPGIASMQHVADVINALTSFQPSNANQVPVSANPAPGAPVYAAGSNWLVGTHFLVLVDKQTGVAMLDLQAVFNDPNLYGLRIALAGPTAKIFAGLYFEIMYRKVTDTIGVYEIVLQLPTAMRTLQFGEVSVTLPTVALQIYTNGNFKVDFGFPANLDFSRSFGLQAFPFVGAGGFYFGVLSGATSSQVPKTNQGVFDTVVVFGIGLQVGLGKSINAGVFSAELSVTVFGIVEGVIARWHPYNAAALDAAEAASPQVQGSYYYWLQGTVGIIGKLQGSIDFAIISATVSITVTIQARITIEAYRAIPVSVSAGVSVRLSVKINLGLFKITIHFSFSYTVQAQFVIGSNQHAPWDPPSLATAAAITRRPPRWLTSPPAFAPLPVVSPTRLTLYFAPHLTLADAATDSSPKAAYVAMLYIQAPVPDQPESAQAMTDFETLATSTFVWAATTFADARPPTTEVAALDAVLSLEQVSDAFSYFAAAGATPPITYADHIKPFLSTQFVLAVSPPPAQDVPGAAVFPMIPDATFTVPAYKDGKAMTSMFASFPMCQPQYLADIQKVFKELAIELTTPLQQQYASDDRLLRLSDPPVAEPLATLVIQDYFALICRHTLQAGADAFKAYPYEATAEDTLQGVADRFNAIGDSTGSNDLSPADIAIANASVPLAGSQPLTLPSVDYPIQAAQTIAAISAMFGNVDPADIVDANQLTPGLLAPDVEMTINGASYTTGADDTFASIVTSTGATLAEVATGAGPVHNLLVPLAVLAIPPFPYMSAVAGTDTAANIAASFGLTVADVASANPTLRFYVPSESAVAGAGRVPISVTGLAYLTGAMLTDAMRAANALSHLAGVCSRYLMNGLRVPVNPDIDLAPDSPYEGLSAGGLYGVMGQQTTLPALDASDAGKFAVTLSAPRTDGWIAFPSANALDFVVDTDQINAINTVLNAAASGLIPAVTSIAALPAAVEGPLRFAFASAIPLQLPVTLALPSGPPPQQTVPAPTVWTFSNGLLALATAPTATAPRVTLLKRALEGSPPPKPTAASSYGWATIVDVALKRLPPAANPAATAANVYQLIGTDSAGIVLLERLLSAIGDGADPIQGLYVLYAPNPTGQAPSGLIGDDPGGVTAFVVQTNLSTETNPPGLRVAATRRIGEGIASPDDFVRRLWETSIVQSGGFYLYYSAGGSSATPLPANAFTAEGAGTVQLLIVYGDTTGALAPYMNAAVVNDRITSGATELYVESAPTEVTHIASESDSLASMGNMYGVGALQLAGQLSTVTLALAGARLAIVTPTYQVRYSDTLADIATRFATTPAAIQAANPGLSIDWSNIPPWTLLAIPVTTYALDAAAPLTTLADIATFYGMDVAGLAWPNLGVTDLFTGTLTIDAQATGRTASLPPGNAGVVLERTPLGADQTKPVNYLDAAFTLLGWQLERAGGFIGGPAGPPASPADSMDEDAVRDHHAQRPPPTLAIGTEDQHYEQLFPVAAYAAFNPLAGTSGHVPPGAANPYAGVGSTAQVQLTWQDVFGNIGVTPLTDPALAPRGPLNEPPIAIGYCDALLGVGQWPSVAADVLFQGDGGSPLMYVVIGFDPCRYHHDDNAPADAAEPPEWEKAARADRQTYAQLYYQLNQTDAAGHPHTTLTVQSALEPGVSHPITGADLAGLLGFVTQAWQFLDDLVDPPTGRAPTPSPDTLIVSLAIAIANPADIFVLDASLTIARAPAVVHPDFRDQAGVAWVDTPLSPRLIPLPTDLTPPDCSMTPLQPDRSLTFFATAFESAFATSTTSYHVATGADRSAPDTEAASQTVWVLRQSTDAAASLYAEIHGPPIYYAPPPLSTSPISRSDVPVYSFDPTTGLDTTNPSYPTFKDIDLDTWSHQALGAIDLALSSQLAVSASIVDTLGGTSHVADLLSAKKLLASNIAATVTNILEAPATADLPHGALDDAQRKLEQQMLITLSSAYTVDVVVQLPTTVNATTDAGYKAPALYGIPLVGGGPTDEPGATAAYTMSAFKITAGAGNHFLTFLLSTRVTAEQPSVTLSPLTYSVTHVEHQIGAVPGIDGYLASTWLTFVNPLPPLAATDEASSLDVPIVLRAYPPTPTLGAQTGVSAVTESTSAATLESAKQWDYAYSFAVGHARQDQLGAITELNLVPGGLSAVNVDALFARLAQLIAVWPPLESILIAELPLITPETSKTDPTFVHAANALAALATLAGNLANAWSPTAAVTLRDGALIAETAQVTVSYTITESSQPGTGELLVVVDVDPISVIPPHLPAPPTPHEVFADYPIIVQTAAGATYQNAQGEYLMWEQAHRDPSRTVALAGMDVMAYQNALSSVFVTRNAQLVPHNPTRHVFVYQTPFVAFATKLTPLLTVDRKILVEDIGTGLPEALPLIAHLERLFATFFSGASSAMQTVKLGAAYRYTVGAPGSGLTTLMPITLAPSFEFRIPTDYNPDAPCADPITPASPFVCKLAAVLHAWFSETQPSANEGVIVFDLSVFSSLEAQDSAASLPLLRLTNLELTREYVTDI